MRSTSDIRTLVLLMDHGYLLRVGKRPSTVRCSSHLSEIGEFTGEIGLLADRRAFPVDDVYGNRYDQGQYSQYKARPEQMPSPTSDLVVHYDGTSQPWAFDDRPVVCDLLGPAYIAAAPARTSLARALPPVADALYSP